MFPIIAVTADLQIALCSDGTNAQIVLLLDDEGQETDDSAEACVAVAKLGEGLYTPFWCAGMDRVTVN